MAELNIEKMTQSVAERAIQELRDSGVFVSRWIPVSERLPEKSGLYLASGKGKVWIAEMLILMGLKGWCGDPREPIVVAWMPLPEPYKEESEDKK